MYRKVDKTNKPVLFWGPWKRGLLFVIFLFVGLGSFASVFSLNDAIENQPSVKVAREKRIAELESEIQSLKERQRSLPPRVFPVPPHLMDNTALVEAAAAGKAADPERTRIMGDIGFLHSKIRAEQNKISRSEKAAGEIPYSIGKTVLGLATWVAGFWLAFIAIPRSKKQWVLITMESNGKAKKAR
ncbi:MAG: hypothetical protein K8S55_05390 [Phycisphaerae bacterium]|nr:hypothetical protein [Phycisphaerae bacterium]